MNNASLQKMLEDLHEGVAKVLLQKVQSGLITPPELNAAIKFLKDNGIEAIPTPDNPLGELANEIPNFHPENYDPH